MNYNSIISDAILNGPLRAFKPADPNSAYALHSLLHKFKSVMTGIVEQFNVGLYSAKVVSEDDGISYNCALGALNVTAGFGFSDANILREGDEVLFIPIGENRDSGMILAKKPAISLEDETHPEELTSRTDFERRTHFFSSDCYRHESQTYSIPVGNNNDSSTRAYGCNRPTDLVAGEYGFLNQHRCGLLGGLYSMALTGGGAHIRLFALENKIRIVADSIMQCTLVGTEQQWHNRRNLSRERTECLYQEERFGLAQKKQVAFDKADYHKDGFFTKNKKKRQTSRPRILEHAGFYGNLSTLYCLRPDPTDPDVRTMDSKPKDPGVARESIDPSGQYRLATTGMLGFERIGRIPVPSRIKYPWQKEVEEREPEELKEFQHDESHPYYRQLELADRVAYDLKNSYARLDEGKDEFYTPEEEDLKGKLRDQFDPGFSNSKTVKLQKYDKRRSGIWQGEDGSIILRDAWGSEIVMLGGNIQISCAGNVETLPGKSALIMAGDDAVVKAQNSIDIESADKDVRMNAFKNVQILAGVNDDNPGGITLEAKGEAFPWGVDLPEPLGGESLPTRGILLKSDKGAVVTDTKTMVLRSREYTSIISGDEELSDGQIFVTADKVYEYGQDTILTTDEAALLLTGTAALVGSSAIVAGTESASIFSADKIFIPLMLLPIDENVGEIILNGLSPLMDIMSNELFVAQGYELEKLDKMIFKFRSSLECGTMTSWEISGAEKFTLYEPFWVQVQPKFETLKGIETKDFEDHKELWGGDRGHPWPGTDAVTGGGRYAQLANMAPVNMTSEGFNVKRSEAKDSSAVTEVDIFPGYKIRK